MNKKDLMKVGVGIGVLALLYFIFKKKSTTGSSTKSTNNQGDNLSLDVTQDKVASLGGDASFRDAIGQKYTLLSSYKAMETKTIKEAPFNRGTTFVKKADRNGSNVNMQDAVKVFLVDGNTEYVIPTAILKKIA
jgi:hypothetical protein